MPALAVAAFPPDKPSGSYPEGDPSESVRANTPDDPDFDRCESDNVGGQTCTDPFDQMFERFGFAPSGTQHSAKYNPAATPARQEAQNTAAGRESDGQVSGVSADRAWKYTTGDPSVRIAILDTGIRWSEDQLRQQIALNAGELPPPEDAGGTPCPDRDCVDDDAYNVDDYGDDARVDEADGPDEAGGVLDAGDLIATFSNGVDDDGNGYVDDIAGWDFFDDDNNPFDASSHFASSNHGTGRAEEAAARGDDGANGIGVCPRCQIVPLRVWDTFVVDTNNFALAVTYAADNGVDVVEGAVGGLFNSAFARAAFDYAYRKGTFFTIVSSDLNTANHNIPTVYDEALQVQGTVADSQGASPGTALDSFPQPVIDFLGEAGLTDLAGVTVGTWFRNSGTTQYGGHAHIVMPAVTGSAATGQASGAAGLIKSYGNFKGTPLAPNEIKQLITLTAEDVHPLNTVGLGTPDPAQVGWDQHFGYGRPDLGAALAAIEAGEIPPQALITGPDWFAPFNVQDTTSVDIEARVSAPRAASYDYELQWAPGIEPAEGDFMTIADVDGLAAPIDGPIGTVDLAAVRAALDALPNGGATLDPTAPAPGPGDTDPNEPAFTVRVVVEDSDGNRGEDRKMLFAYDDPTLHDGWSKAIGAGGEASPRLFDLDGDNALDVIQADSAGRLHVLDAEGSPLPSFNGGARVQTLPYPNVHGGAPVFGELAPPREVLRTPAIGDIDGDMEPEIVDSAGEHVYTWNADGSLVAGFPVRIDPAFSLPADRTRDNHVKRGFAASPTLGDIDDDGVLDIVIPALDQHLYGFRGNGGPLPGFPTKLAEAGLDGAESINTAAVGDIDGDERLEIVMPTNEVDPDPTTPGPPSPGIGGYFGGLVINILSNALGGSGRIYAVAHDGSIEAGWPIARDSALPDVLPFVGPGADQVIGDVDGDGEGEVVGNLAAGTVTAVNGDGSEQGTYDGEPSSGEHVDKSVIVNLFENPVVANFDGLPGLEVLKGGLTLNQLVNLGVAVGQNLPYNHVLQAWNGQTGASLPSFPQAVEDYQLLSTPAIADVHIAPGQEAIVGTGLYLLRAINAAGLEAPGWPKFTGGWLFATPAVGDADGDGQLEVTALTREGHAFLWDTDSPACGTTDEWPSSRHDEHNSGNYDVDARPPGTPRELKATALSPVAAQLEWLAPGDDWLCGQATHYVLLRSSNGPIEHPADGEVVMEVEAAAAGEQEEQTVLPALAGDHLAVLYRDEAGNHGHLARVQVGEVGDGPSESPDGGDGAGPAGGATGGPGVLDRIPPVVRLSAPRYASDIAGYANFPVSWRATDRGGSGLAFFVVQYRHSGTDRWITAFGGPTRRTGARVRGFVGVTYEIRVVALDLAANRSGIAFARSTVPVDDRKREARFSGLWRALRLAGFYNSTAAGTFARGALAGMRFFGRHIALIGPRWPGGGVLAVTVDGRTRLVSQRGPLARRQVLYRSPVLLPTRHVIIVRVLRGPALVDAYGVTR